MADVDEELEGEGEAVAEESGGDEDGVDGSVEAIEGDVAVADGLVGELGGVGGGDHGGFVGGSVRQGGFGAACGHGERDEVVGFAAEGGGDGDGDGLDHAVEVGGGKGGFAKGGEADAVGCFAHDDFAGDLGSLNEPALNTFSHKAVF